VINLRIMPAQQLRPRERAAAESPSRPRLVSCNRKVAAWRRRPACRLAASSVSELDWLKPHQVKTFKVPLLGNALTVSGLSTISATRTHHMMLRRPRRPPAKVFWQKSLTICVSS
jgi:hypothetical protein